MFSYALKALAKRAIIILLIHVVSSSKYSQTITKAATTHTNSASGKTLKKQQLKIYKKSKKKLGKNKSTW